MNQSIRELFEAAISLPEQGRAAFIDAQFADPGSSDTELRAQLRRMLEADQCASDIGDAAALSAAIGEVKPMQHEIGSRVGPFTIEERIGDGGSSVIYRASREIAGTRQVVALKILRRGMYAPEARRLFDRERKALAALHHPSIANFIDGGVEPSGQAYLALELVDGMPITEYARSKTLDFRTRLKLFEQVARAVAAAHRALIVHRDLKPANVMITNDGHVKLLDFGIAKILSDELDLTRTEFQAFTPAYAAPEQRDGGPITTATDVYSLGILLGELLTGQRVTDGQLRTPSACITDYTTIEGVLPASPSQTRRLLRGDLDNIVMKALELEPERRYASAGEFADDIERLLAGQPVKAHPPSRRYRMGKFIKRNRVSAIVVALLLGLLLSTLGMLWQSLLRAQAAQVAAQTQLQRADAVRGFIDGLFDSVRLGTAAGKAPSVRDLVLLGGLQLRAHIDVPIPQRIELLTLFANLHENVGELAAAQSLAEEAVGLSEQHLSARNPLRIQARAMRGFTSVRRERYAEAEADLRPALAEMRAQELGGSAFLRTLESLQTVENLAGNTSAYLQLTLEALTLSEKLYAADDPRRGTAYNNLASTYEGLDDYPNAQRWYQKAIDYQLRTLGQNSEPTILSQCGLASTNMRWGRWLEAFSEFKACNAHFDALAKKPQITRLYAGQKWCALASRLLHPERDGICRASSAMAKAMFGERSDSLGDALYHDGSYSLELGRDTVAGTQLLQARNTFEDNRSNRSRLGIVDLSLAEIAQNAGHLAETKATLPKVIELLQARAYRMNPLQGQAMLLLSCEGAIDLVCPATLRATIESSRAQLLAWHHPQMLTIDVLLARVDLALRPQLASARLEPAIAIALRQLNPDHPRILAAQLWLSTAYAESKQCAQANALRQAIATRLLAWPDHAALRYAREANAAALKTQCAPKI